MPLVERAAGLLGLDASDAVELAGSASGAGVYRVRFEGGDAVLKVTDAGEGQLDARRELAFYQSLANKVPVITPTLLRYADGAEHTALLLSAHSPPVPAAEWDREAWLEIARQLAELHSMAVPSGDPWIQGRPDAPSMGLAEAYWSATEAAGCLLEPDALAEAVRAMPDSFIHGDCHVGNLLRDGDRIVWADWQVAKVGSPAGDLALLWSRGGVDGADLPYDAMLREYATRRGLELAPLRRAVIAAELALLLFAWPHFAAYRTESDRTHLTHRLLDLTASWQASDR
ncbi:aminoglycoside phosphotransferase family protein [Kribbella sp. NBC_01245]|uniref:aminoglycoside phosphotransferase family protein n=1 Tax=Kribbella sp. NBC_01245 TaxID=2903578 RepID=UPI002E28BE44|nr:aminoglycoside phosphotransferase family protein [Kribbella sp. NBC_01245]